MVWTQGDQRNIGLCFREKNTIKDIIDSLDNRVYVVEIKILYQYLTH